MRQGCWLSIFLFTLVVYWIVRTSTEGRRNDTQWTLWPQLDDPDFANDLALLSHSHAQTQDKTHAWIQHQTGQVSAPLMARQRSYGCSTPVPTSHSSRTTPWEVNSFTYLGSMTDTQDWTDTDVRTGIGKARSAFLILANLILAVSREDKQREPIEDKDSRTNGRTDPQKTVGLDWPHPQDVCQ